MANEILCWQASEFVLRHRERDYWTVLRRQPGSREFFKERNIAVTIDCIDDACITAGREFLDLADNGLVIRVAERGVFPRTDGLAALLAQAPADVLFRDPLGEQVFKEDKVGGLRVNVIRANKIEFFLPGL